MSVTWRIMFTFSFLTERVTTSRHINDLFNAGQYWLRTELEGEFQQYVIYSELARADADFEPGTLSEMIIYHQDFMFKARVHQMLLPGDKKTPAGLPYLGGYGEPDCKELIEDDVYYHLPPPKTPKAIRRRSYLTD